MTFETKISGAPVDNGVDTASLIGARAAFEQAPEAASFTFRSSCDWITGTQNRNTLNGCMSWIFRPRIMVRFIWWRDRC